MPPAKVSPFPICPTFHFLVFLPTFLSAGENSSPALKMVPCFLTWSFLFHFVCTSVSWMELFFLLSFSFCYVFYRLILCLLQSFGGFLFPPETRGLFGSVGALCSATLCSVAVLSLHPPFLCLPLLYPHCLLPSLPFPVRPPRSSEVSANLSWPSHASFSSVLSLSLFLWL